MKITILLIVVVLSAYGCSNPKSGYSVSKNEVYSVSLDELKPIRKIIPLSRMVEYCNLVYLEPKENAYVVPMSTTITEKYIGVIPAKMYVGQGYETYKLFDRSGKFLCDVGSTGSGYGEYLALTDDIIDDQNELIYLSSFSGSNKILVYNTSGQFVKEIIAPQLLCNPQMFLTGNILTVVHIPMDSPDPSYVFAYKAADAMVFQFDVNTAELLKKIAPPAHLIIENFNYGSIHTPRNTPGNFDFFLHYYFTISDYRDTLYRVDMKSDKILPVFTMTYSSSKFPHKPTFYQLNKDLIMSFFYNNNALVATDLKSKTSTWVRIANDYYGNIPVPGSTWLGHFRNGYFAHNMKPEDLIKEIKKRLAEKDCTEDDRLILNKTLSTLKKEDNNVVFIGKLKSETNLW